MNKIHFPALSVASTAKPCDFKKKEGGILTS
jgi:hypothetical protein